MAGGGFRTEVSTWKARRRNGRTEPWSCCPAGPLCGTGSWGAPGRGLLEDQTPPEIGTRLPRSRWVGPASRAFTARFPVRLCRWGTPGCPGPGPAAWGALASGGARGSPSTLTELPRSRGAREGTGLGPPPDPPCFNATPEGEAKLPYGLTVSPQNPYAAPDPVCGVRRRRCRGHAGGALGSASL